MSPCTANQKHKSRGREGGGAQTQENGTKEGKVDKHVEAREEAQEEMGGLGERNDGNGGRGK